MCHSIFAFDRSLFIVMRTNLISFSSHSKQIRSQTRSCLVFHRKHDYFLAADDFLTAYVSKQHCGFAYVTHKYDSDIFCLEKISLIQMSLSMNSERLSLFELNTWSDTFQISGVLSAKIAVVHAHFCFLWLSFQHRCTEHNLSQANSLLMFRLDKPMRLIICKKVLLELATKSGY